LFTTAKASFASSAFCPNAEKEIASIKTVIVKIFFIFFIFSLGFGLLQVLFNAARKIFVALTDNNNAISPDNNEGENEKKKKFRFSFVCHIEFMSLLFEFVSARL
jgi:hypothetical protein